MIRFNGFNHLAFATSDIDMTVRFWRDLLGLKLIGGLGDKTYRLYFFELSPTDMIAFFEWQAVEKVELKDHGMPVTGPFSFDHVSIGVESDHDLWLLKSRLEASDFWVSEIIDHGFIHSIYAFDPNNIPIEFSSNVAEINLRTHPLMKDRKPSDTAKEGSDPQPGVWPEPGPADPMSIGDIFPGEGRIFCEDT